MQYYLSSRPLYIPDRPRDPSSASTSLIIPLLLSTSSLSLFRSFFQHATSYKVSKDEESKGKKADESHLPRVTPAWVLGLAQEGNGTEPCFIMSKILTKTDLSARHNRLLIPATFVKAHLIPFLSDEERAAANLVDPDRKRKRLSTKDGGHETEKMKLAESGGEVLQEPGEGEASKDQKDETTSKKKKEAGRKHGGLHVPVYVGANKWKAYVMMTRWDSSNRTILKGGEYSSHLARWSGIKVGDKVELWGFRHGENGGPCFLLHRIKEEGE